MLVLFSTNLSLSLSVSLSLKSPFDQLFFGGNTPPFAANMRPFWLLRTLLTSKNEKLVVDQERRALRA